jgi:hypothetical protein
MDLHSRHNNVAESKGNKMSTVTKREEVIEKTPRDKYREKGVRGVLVNLPLDVADAFYAKARETNSKPTKVARELIVAWLNS